MSRPVRYIDGARIVEPSSGRSWPNTPDVRHALGAVLRPSARRFTVADGSVDRSLARVHAAAMSGGVA